MLWLMQGSTLTLARDLLAHRATLIGTLTSSDHFTKTAKAVLNSKSDVELVIFLILLTGTSYFRFKAS